MIQRRQTLWLLLSALGAFLSFEFPFFSYAPLVVNTTVKLTPFTAGSTFVLMVLTGASILLSIVTLCMYKDRKLQLRLCFVGLAISIITIILFFVEMQKHAGSISLWVIFAFAVPVGYLLAARGIHRDEKLVRSLDKLR